MHRVRNGLAVSLCLCLCLCVSGAEVELYMVMAEHVELYRNSRDTGTELLPGEVVKGRTDDSISDWLVVAYRGQTYSVERRYLRSRTELESAARRRIAAVENRILTAEDELDGVLSQISELHAAEIAIRFDGAVQYKLRTLVRVPVASKASGPIRRVPGGATEGATRLIARYSYRDKISPRDSRARQKRWEDDREELEKERRELLDDFRDLAKQLAAERAALAATRRRFAAYRVSERKYLSAPYVTVCNRVQLFAGKRLAHELERDIVVLARRNRDYDDWLHVQYRQQMFDGPAAAFLSRTEYESRYRRWEEDRRVRMLELEGDIRILKECQDAIRRAQLVLDYESRLSRFPLTQSPFGAGYPGYRVYLPERTPRDATEVVDRSRARRIHRDWDDELEEIEADLTRKRREAGHLREDLAAAVPRFESVMRRFAAIDPVPEAF